MKKGEIFHCDDFRHYFVFLEEIDRDTFKGIMLTTRWSFRGDKVPFQTGHFKQIDEKGQKYLIPREQSFFPFAALVKRSNISGLTKVGELTEDGINYVEVTIENQILIKWAEFVRQQKRKRFESKQR